MLVIKVSKSFVWPVRIFFIFLAVVVCNYMLDVYLRGFVISAGTTKYEYGSPVFFTHMLKYIALDFLLVLLAVRTVEKD